MNLDLNHPSRISLASEAHSRPFMPISAPAGIAHLAVYLGNQNAGGQSNQRAGHGRLLALLCEHFGASPPYAEATHFYHDFGALQLKWENHLEFSTYTFVQVADSDDPFTCQPMNRVPASWMQALAGQLIVAAQVSLVKTRRFSGDGSAILSHFPGDIVIGSEVLDGCGEVWSNFQVQADGFARFLICDTGLRDSLQTGRLVHRVLELETYRMMAMLAFPLAREAAPRTAAMEQRLVQVIQQIENHSGQDEQHLLQEISHLAAQVEAAILATSYRFSAAQAYYRLVQTRLMELRETRIETMSQLGEFLLRRLTPAMETCQYAALQQENLAKRVARANALLRTRVGLTQEQQSREILQSLNQRAAQQLRLQQAVEGLSIFAIAYYLLGLCHYGFKALGKLLPVEPEMATGIALPIVLLGVWWSVRYFKKALH